MKRNSLPKLSICIPTYNRSQKLANCLRSITRGSGSVAKEFEIIVSNNASTDDTSVVLKDFDASGFNFNCIHQVKNIGAEANFWFLWKAATADYVWILGDDDELEENAIVKVLDTLRQTYDFLLLNYSRWSADLSSCTNYSVFGNLEKKIDNPNKLMSEFGPELSYISCVVLRRPLLDVVDESKFRDLSATGFSFMYAVYKSLFQKKIEGLLVSESLVKNRNATATSYNWDNYFIVGISQVLDALVQEGYSSKSISAAKNQVLRIFIFPKFKARRLKGEDLKEKWPMLLRNYRTSWRLWFLVAPVMWVPVFALAIISGLSRRMLAWSK